MRCTDFFLKQDLEASLVVTFWRGGEGWPGCLTVLGERVSLLQHGTEGTALGRDQDILVPCEMRERERDERAVVLDRGGWMDSCVFSFYFVCVCEREDGLIFGRDGNTHSSTLAEARGSSSAADA